jgi:hypothetical protein
VDHDLGLGIGRPLREAGGVDGRVHVALAHPQVHPPAGLALDVGSEEQVRQEQDLPVLRDAPHDIDGVRGRAADVGLRLDLGRGVHVGDDDRAGVLGLPGPQLLGGDGGRERAPGLEVGQQDGLGGGEDLRGLGHEVHPAEHDRRGRRGRGLPGERERVPDEVRDVLDPGDLVVVGEDHRVALAREPTHLGRPGLEGPRLLGRLSPHR